jgi:hypothetical protein
MDTIMDLIAKAEQQMMGDLWISKDLDVVIEGDSKEPKINVYFKFPDTNIMVCIVYETG